MGLFPQQFIDDLRQQVNIVTVIQDYVPLKHVGNNHKGLCPFHSEKTPSFTVHADKGFFHCFGCNAGGDVFKFLELHEKMGFQDAVRMLAQRFGVAIPEMEGSSDDARKDASLREALLKVHEIAAVFFQEQLAAPSGARARRQLADRGVETQTIEQLGLGYAPVASGLHARLLAQGFAEGLLLQSGLILKRDRGDVVDRFRNRLMVPICRDAGSVDRLRRPRDGRRAGAEIPELAGNGHLFEGADAVRSESDEIVDSDRSASRCWSRAISTSRRCFRRRQRRSWPPAERP